MERKELPLPIGDRAAFIRKAAVALDIVDVPTAKVVTYSIPYSRVEVIHVPLESISADVNTKGQYYVDGGHVSGGPAAMSKTHLSWLRSMALQNGATPEAIRLLTKATGAFTKKEEHEMAEKLKAQKATKSAATPDKDGLKAAAKAAPAAKTAAAPKKKGNAEALAKARAARSTGPDTRKVKGLVKPKDLSARPGTFRHTMLSDLLSSKTVQEFRDKNPKYDASCVKFAVDSGVVALS